MLRCIKLGIKLAHALQDFPQARRVLLAGACPPADASRMTSFAMMIAQDRNYEAELAHV